MMKMMKMFMKMMKMMMKMTMQAGDMLEGLCGEASVEAWLWRPPPGVKSDIFHIILQYNVIDIPGHGLKTCFRTSSWDFGSIQKDTPALLL